MLCLHAILSVMTCWGHKADNLKTSGLTGSDRITWRRYLSGKSFETNDRIMTDETKTTLSVNSYAAWFLFNGIVVPRELHTGLCCAESQSSQLSLLDRPVGRVRSRNIQETYKKHTRDMQR